jgi:hypothetical protein
MKVVATLLGKDPEAIIALELPFVFDLAAPKSPRQYLSVWHGALRAFVAGQLKSLPPWPAVLSEILGPARTLEVRHLAREWCVDASHVINLAEAGEISFDTRFRRTLGRGHSLRLVPASVAAFLDRMRLS